MVGLRVMQGLQWVAGARVAGVRRVVVRHKTLARRRGEARRVVAQLPLVEPRAPVDPRLQVVAER